MNRGYKNKNQKVLYCIGCGKPIVVDANVKKVLCANCVQIQQIKKYGIPNVKKYFKSDKPRGWHFMKKFVDKNGDLYEKGKLIKEKTKLVPTIKTETFKKKQKNKLAKKKRKEQKKKENKYNGTALKLAKEIAKIKRELKKLNGGRGSKGKEKKYQSLMKKYKKIIG